MKTSAAASADVATSTAGSTSSAAGSTTTAAGSTSSAAGSTTSAAGSTTSAAAETTTSASDTTTATVVCPEGWIDASESDLGCLYFADSGLSWFETQSICETAQGFSAEALTLSQVKANHIS